MAKANPKKPFSPVKRMSKKGAKLHLQMKKKRMKRTIQETMGNIKKRREKKFK